MKLIISNIEPHDSNLAQNLTILLIIIVLFIVGIIYTKREHDKKFGLWFKTVLDHAPLYGFTQQEIDEFEELFWWDYFCQDLTAEEAIQEHKKTL